MGDRHAPTLVPLPEDVLREANGSELKVTLAVARIAGERMVTIRQFQGATGLSRTAVQTGIEAAMKRGYVWRRGGPNNTWIYRFRANI